MKFLKVDDEEHSLNFTLMTEEEIGEHFVNIILFRIK